MKKKLRKMISELQTDNAQTKMLYQLLIKQTDDNIKYKDYPAVEMENISLDQREHYFDQAEERNMLAMKRKQISDLMKNVNEAKEMENYKQKYRKLKKDVRNLSMNIKELYRKIEGLEQDLLKEKKQRKELEREIMQHNQILNYISFKLNISKLNKSSKKMLKDCKQDAMYYGTRNKMLPVIDVEYEEERM